jgi:tRNA pseudouridine55 synthase
MYLCLIKTAKKVNKGTSIWFLVAIVRVNFPQLSDLCTVNDLNLLRPTAQLPDPFPKGALLLIDKPLGWTSFDVVQKVRYWLGKRTGIKRIKVGHAGTLDPLATGLLLLCIGDHTRRIELLQGMDKVYTGTLTFGAETASYDLEKPVEPSTDTTLPSDADLARAVVSFLGAIEQYPPVFSAIKVDGKRLYSSARKGGEVALTARPVQVHEFLLGALRPVPTTDATREVQNLSAKGHPIWQYPDHAQGVQADFRIVCSKGTYIRSLAHDMGELLGCGAYLSALRRTDNGHFSVQDAWDLDTLVGLIRE